MCVWENETHRSSSSEQLTIFDLTQKSTKIILVTERVFGDRECVRERVELSCFLQVGQFMNTERQEKGLATDTTAEVRWWRCHGFDI